MGWEGSAHQGGWALSCIPYFWLGSSNRAKWGLSRLYSQPADISSLKSSFKKKKEEEESVFQNYSAFKFQTYSQLKLTIVKTLLFPKYGQSVFIILRFHICKFAYLLKFVCNLQKQSSTFLRSFIDMCGTGSPPTQLKWNEMPLCLLVSALIW